MALRTSKLSKNCASRGLVGPFRRAARAEKGPPGLQGGGGAAAPAAPPPWLRACGAARANSGPLCPPIFKIPKCVFFFFGVKFLQFIADAVKSRPQEN